MSLNYALLGLLSITPMNGYSIKAFFDEAINSVWHAELSQIYRELEALEQKGLLSSTIEQQRDRPNKRLYRATDEGKRSFMDWLSSPPLKFDMPKRDEFMLRLLFGSMAGPEVAKKEFRLFIDQMWRVRARSGEGSNLAARFPDDPVMAKADQVCRDDMYCRFIHRRAAMTSETLIAWAQECLAELESLPASGAGKS
jgi:PadR family transcriptional regulator, regulatory protein AphA